MSGHNKWANIKQRKGAQDAKRSNVFSKIAKEIIIAAKAGGGDPSTNSSLRTLIDKARSNNMPKDKITNAIKRGTGEIAGGTIDEMVYEGYGPGGVAVILDIATDNKNRTAPEIRKIFSRRGGSLGAGGCVAWMFDKKGMIALDGEGISEDEVMEVALDLGADDVSFEDGTIEVYTEVDQYMAVLDGLKEKGYKITDNDIVRIPQNTVKLESDKAVQFLKLMNELENQDDVQKAAANADIDDEIIQNFEG